MNDEFFPYRVHMEMLFNIFLWGFIIGVIHFIILGALYANPFIDRLYKKAQSEFPGVRKWDNQKEYLLKMFAGTQVEVYIISAGFFYLRQFLPFQPMELALITGIIFSGIRIYPRFWNMWIQSTYPATLLAIEFINGIIGTFIITIGLSYITSRGM